MRVFDGVDDLRSAVGTQLGTGEWVTIDQKQIDIFADATDDHQWIHTDPERAETGPFKGPIAHGYLTLSLLPPLWCEVLQIDGITMTVNYGLNKVRFTAPVPVGARVRANVELTDVTDVEGGVQVLTKVTVEIEGSERPALVAEWLTRRYV